MKRFLVGIMAVMVLLSGSAAFAEDTKVSLGVKGWVNSWEISDSFGNSVESDNAILMVGPSLNIKSGSGLFLGASYLVSTGDYEFSYFNGVQDVVDKYDRKDLDVLAGVMFTPNFGAFIGYKSIKSDLTEEDMFGNELASGWIKFTGPGFGILGNIPLGDTVALYGNLSFMFMEYEGASGFTEDAPGASIEFGLAAALSPEVSGNVGIKSQSFTGADTELQHTFTGLTFGMNLTF